MWIQSVTIQSALLIILYIGFAASQRRYGGFGIGGGYNAYRRYGSTVRKTNTKDTQKIENTNDLKNKQVLEITKDTRIIMDTNGTQDVENTPVTKAPWHVGVYTKTTNPYMQICGGTVIAKHVVVTAAHCVTPDRNRPSASLYAVAAGKLYRPWNDPNDKGAQKSDVKEIKIPPRYQGAVANFQEDIALLILAEEFKYNEFVRPACLNFNAAYDNKQLDERLGSIVGWGLTGEDSLPSQILQAAELPGVPIDKCIEQSPVSFRSSITGDKICAGHTNGTAVCRGDSGGGLTITGIVKRVNVDPPCFELHVFLRGIVSTSPTSENRCNIYTWATFTHLLRHEHFVKTVLPDVEESCEPLMVWRENELPPM